MKNTTCSLINFQTVTCCMDGALKHLVPKYRANLSIKTTTQALQGYAVPNPAIDYSANMNYKESGTRALSKKHLYIIII